MCVCVKMYGKIWGFQPLNVIYFMLVFYRGSEEIPMAFPAPAKEKLCSVKRHLKCLVDIFWKNIVTGLHKSAPNPWIQYIWPLKK